MNYKEAAEYIKQKIGDRNPETAIILGSGLGVLKEDIENKVVIEYKDIPEFPISTVEGHAGELIIGELSGKTIIAMNRKISLLRRISYKTNSISNKSICFIRSKKCYPYKCSRWNKY